MITMPSFKDLDLLLLNDIIDSKFIISVTILILKLLFYFSGCNFLNILQVYVLMSMNKINI